MKFVLSQFSPDSTRRVFPVFEKGAWHGRYFMGTVPSPERISRKGVLLSRTGDSVGIGDVFVFYSTFVTCRWNRGKYEVFGHSFQAIWGFMQIGRMYTLEVDKPNGNVKRFTTYSGGDCLSCGRGVRKNAKGILAYSDKFRLTEEGERPYIWRRNALPWMDYRRKDPHASGYGRISFVDGIFDSRRDTPDAVSDDVFQLDGNRREACLEWLMELSSSIYSPRGQRSL